jgi:uncharacterized protein YjgD (DUF1641 family)
MAKPLAYTVTPPKTEQDAQEALAELVETLHQHGVLRFANDLVASQSQVAAVLVGGLNTEGAQNALQNLGVLAMWLSRIEPARLYKVLFAVKDGLDGLGDYRPGPEEDTKPPGLTGAYALLHDEALWRALIPAIEALKVFADGLDRDLQKPITAYSGKAGAPS